MTHYRGQIVKSKDILGDTFYKVFTGCHFIDDFYTCNTENDAKKISKELTLNEA